MKSIKIAAASALALALTSFAANAAQVIHITGSTAFRGATVQAIENKMDASGAYTVAYVASGNVTNGGELGANNVVLNGSIDGVATTVKCTWTGSTGGILLNAKQLNITQLPLSDNSTGWMSITNLPTSGSTVANVSLVSGNKTLKIVSTTAGAASYSLDTGTFPTETQKSDVNMADSLQSSTPYATPALTSIPVGVIVFEWVANNGSPATLKNITNQLAQNVFAGGGALLSQFTGNVNDVTPVYGLGRNFDSGTRLSQLAETEIGVLGGVQQMQIGFTGTLGAGATMTSLSLYQAETLFPSPFTVSYAVGQSGYASGGTVADGIATPGSSTAPSLSGRAPLFGDGGWLVAYVGRNDANRAVRTTAGANTARRLTYNGVSDWTADGSLPSAQYSTYNDAVVTEGLYQAWESEFLQYKSGLTTAQVNAITSIATRITTADAAVSGILNSAMNVSKTVEGGLISHN